VFEKKSGEVEVPPIDGRIEGASMRRVPFLREIGIRATFQQQTRNFQMSPPGSKDKR